MDISKLNLFSLMQTNLSYLNERQNVLAQNIANANVPGYIGKDLEKPNFSAVMGSLNGSSLKLTTDAPGQISGTNLAGATNAVISSKDKTGEITPSGNSVVIEDEVLKMSKNNLEYTQTTDLYAKMVGLVKTAIGSGS